MSEFTRTNRLYHIWRSMKKRCHCPTCPDYPRYGGRGITVCDEWRDSFPTFEEWAFANGYSDELSIDRIDNNQGYMPNNCRWATPKQQAQNRRERSYDHRWYTIDGLNLRQYCEKHNLSYFTVQARIKKYGWTIEMAVSKEYNPGRVD